MKAMSRAIGAEAKEQGKLMDSLEASMEQAKSMLNMGMKKLNRVARQGKSWHLVYLVLFAVALIVVVLFLAKLAGWIRFFICLPSPLLGHYCSRKKHL